MHSFWNVGQIKEPGLLVLLISVIQNHQTGIKNQLSITFGDMHSFWNVGQIKEPGLLVLLISVIQNHQTGIKNQLSITFGDMHSFWNVGQIKQPGLLVLLISRIQNHPTGIKNELSITFGDMHSFWNVGQIKEPGLFVLLISMIQTDQTDTLFPFLSQRVTQLDGLIPPLAPAPIDTGTRSHSFLLASTRPLTSVSNLAHGPRCSYFQFVSPLPGYHHHIIGDPLE